MLHRARRPAPALDCGLMFPDADMHGIDLVLPDFTYLRDNADRIEGCVATHGHEDHVGGLSYLLRDCSFPIYGSPLTLGLARNRIEEAGLLGRTELRPGRRRRASPHRAVRRRVHPGHPLGAPRLRHRRAHAAGRDPALRRLQARPHAGRRPAHRPRPHRRHRADRGHPAAAVRLDQRRGARPRPERARRRRRCSGDRSTPHEGRRIITACFASHIHRIQQIADAAVASGRIVATLGLSMRKNVRLARDLGLLRIPDDRAGRHRGRRRPTRPAEVCVISTGSQGEPMSALSLLAAEREPLAQAERRRHCDPVEPRHPGQRVQREPVIDGLLRLGAEVVHSGVADVHATGHAQADELKTLLSIARPEWFVAGPRRVPPPAGPRQLAARWACGATTSCVCEDGDVVDRQRRRRGADRAGAGRLPLRRRHRRRRRPRRAPRPPVLAEEGCGGGRGGRRRGCRAR